MTVAGAKKFGRKHAGNAVSGLSGAAVVWIYTTFAPIGYVQREIDKEHERCVEQQCQRWSDLMTMLELEEKTRKKPAGKTTGKTP